MIARVLCLLGGTLIAFSVPPWGWWPLGFVGVAIAAVALAGANTWRQRFLFGLLVALPWMALGLAWMWFLTPPGYIIAILLFSGLHAIAAALTPPGRYRIITGPAAHALAELVRMTVPFGGVPLATLALGQSGGPLLFMARLGGAPLLNWVVLQVGVLGAVAGAGAIRYWHRDVQPTGLSWRQHQIDPQVALMAASLVTVALGAALVAPNGADTGETLTVAAVQGGGQQGTSALEVPAGQVTQAHLDATGRIDTTNPPDVIIWPENAIDVDDEPFVDSAPFDAVADVAAALDTPIVVGVTEDSEYSLQPRPDSFVNAQVVVTAEGEITDRYEKVRIVPFGEYIPLRSMLERLGADLSLVAQDAVPGLAPAQLDLPNGHRLGVMISWEVFFGWRGRAAAANGAEFLINPTNGASYTWTIVQTQQIASSRLRAVETGRWVVQVAPTGLSAFVSADGAVFNRTAVSEQAVIQRQIPMRTGATWYQRVGDQPLTGVMLVVLLIGWVLNRRTAVSITTNIMPVACRDARHRGSSP